MAERSFAVSATAESISVFKRASLVAIYKATESNAALSAKFLAALASKTALSAFCWAVRELETLIEAASKIAFVSVTLFSR